MNTPPVIVHIIYRLAIGGLENGLVNLINRMPKDRYRHMIICADDYTDFKNRIQREDVEIYALRKRPGNDLNAQYRLWKLLRKLKPDIVHTRNLGTIEYTIPAFFAGVKYRVHGEHGRDMSDIDGSNRKFIILRRFYNLFLHRFIALSRDLESYLLVSVGIKRQKLVQLYNGVDIARFQRSTQRDLKATEIVFGTVGRLQAEKDQATLIRSFKLLIEYCSAVKTNMPEPRLVLVGNGPDRGKLEQLISELNLNGRVTFLGARDDIPEQLNGIDVFVLPSLGEGISNTILEAMASSLPVIATAVGGNPELVDDGKTGLLVPSANPDEMAKAMQRYIDEPDLIEKHGVAGRKRVEDMFSMDAMVNAYMAVYDDLLSRSSSKAGRDEQ